MMAHHFCLTSPCHLCCPSYPGPAPHVHYPVMDTAGWYCGICGVRYATYSATSSEPVTIDLEPLFGLEWDEGL